MTHEFENILWEYKKQVNKAVLATLVKVSGSSYRGPDARMLIMDDGRMIGALSGGCVEKEILRQSERVFEENRPLMIEYDGRYRLGCEGILNILIEPFDPPENLSVVLGELLENRKTLAIDCYHPEKPSWETNAGSNLIVGEKRIPFRPNVSLETNLPCLQSRLKPKFRLLLFGGEHDAAALAKAGIQLGWEIVLINPPEIPIKKEGFPSRTRFIAAPAGTLPLEIDHQTAIMLMSHNYARDLSCLVELTSTLPVYLGVLGPVKRREQLLNELIERVPDISTDFLDRIYGPAGLNLGAITPQEIALSVLSEILSVTRGQEVYPLREKIGKIHQ